MTSDSSVVPGCSLRYLARAATIAVRVESDAVVFQRADGEKFELVSVQDKKAGSDLNNPSTNPVRIPEDAV